jgi:hypothetical protein
MIDQRIGHLLVRSGDIESKIERLESEAPPTLRDDPVSPRSKPIPPSKPSKPISQSIGDTDVARLVRAILAMQTAVQKIREDQRRTSQQINEIHAHLKKRRSATNSD